MTAIQDCLDQAGDALSSDPLGELSFQWRVRVFDAMMAAFGPEGPTRWKCLALFAAQRSLAKWNRSGVPLVYVNLPRELMRLTASIILGTISGSEACAQTDLIETKEGEFYGDVDEGKIVLVEYSAALQIAFEAFDVAMLIDDGTRLADEGESPDPFFFESMDNAAINYRGQAGEIAWSVSARRKYWTRWLREYVPEACEDMQSLLEKVKIHGKGWVDPEQPFRPGPIRH